MKKQKKIYNDYGECVGTAFNEEAETAEVCGAHLNVVTAEDLTEGNTDGKKTSVIIKKAGFTKKRNIWVFGEELPSQTKWVKAFTPSVFCALLDGINGIYVACVYDANGFPIGFDWADNVDLDHINNMLVGNRVLLLDGKPFKICA